MKAKRIITYILTMVLVSAIPLRLNMLFGKNL